MMKTSAAYDLSTFEPAAQPRVRVRVAAAVDTKERRQRSFRNRCIASVLVIGFLMCATVYSRLTLTETAARINSGTQTLKALESENAYLSYQLESAVSLRNAEDYAVNELGLVKLGSGQIEYVNLQEGDVIAKSGTDFDLSQEMHGLLNGVIEFFGG
ncbi:MAG: hypothetical protein VB021_02575 [Oscillospiraceae bacterium]|nr:hypothetical protein [Oscillospiraceae bacterium]